MALPDRLRAGGLCRREVALLTHAPNEPRAGIAGPYRLLVFDHIGSTNDEAMARLKAGDPGGLVIQGLRQSGGRGRQGRVWQSPPGNLYASVALRLEIDPAVAPQLGFVAGVALASVLRERLGGDARLRIKWPNDMIFAGAKLAGLLLESATLRASAIACVVGFGVNCQSHPDDVSYPATDLAQAGDPDPMPEGLLPALAAALAAQLEVWDRGSGFAQTRAAWLSLAMDVGTQLAVKLPKRHMSGTFQGLDSAGRLLLQSGDGPHVVDAGDVFLFETATNS